METRIDPMPRKDNVTPSPITSDMIIKGARALDRKLLKLMGWSPSRIDRAMKMTRPSDVSMQDAKAVLLAALSGNQ